VAEGAELLGAALAAGVSVESVYLAPEGRTNSAVSTVADRAFAAGARVFDLAPGVIGRVTDTVTPQPVVAVVSFQPTNLADLDQAGMVLVCVDVRDPGNVGTMIRAADAAGVDAVVCCQGTVDPTNPKTVRASAGSIFHIPVVIGEDGPVVVSTLRAAGMRVVGADVRGGVDYTSFDWCQRLAVVFGNEASGLDPDLGSALDGRVSIPMEGRAESLNVSVSAAILSFEALRQRRQSSDWVRTSPGAGDVRPTMPGMRSASANGEQGGGNPGGAR
jgi:TrmH family RNA methyltransferase